MKEKFLRVFVWILILFLGGLGSVFASSRGKTIATKEPNLVNIYFFHSDTCPHCQAEGKLLDRLEKKYSYVKVYRYEVHSPDSQMAMEEARSIFNLKMDGVPVTIIGASSFTGFVEGSSNQEFMKAISYYSKYGYRDELGEYLQLSDLPSYPILDTNPSLDEYLENSNVKLLGFISTDSLDSYFVSFLLGFLSGGNLLFLASMIGIYFLLRKIGGERNQILLLGSYLSISFVMYIVSFFNRDVTTLIFFVGMVLLFTYSLVRYYQNKRRNYLVFNLLMVLAIFVHYVEIRYFGKYFSLVGELEYFYQFVGLDKFGYYMTYMLAIMIVYLGIFMIYCSVRKIQNRG